MCIIASKAAGIEMPKEEYIANMFSANNDGAGLMYAANGKVNIEKGFMEYETFAKRLNEISKVIDLRNTAVVMHFRITTHGGTKPENCHPFPVTDSIGLLKKIRCRTNLGVAHNGIIDVTPRSKDISDTMEYIAGRLAPLKRAIPRFYTNKDLMQMIYHGIQSKMVFLTPNNELFYIGDFVTEDGIKYSNSSYKYKKLLRNFPYYFESDLLDNYIEDYYVKMLMWLDDRKGEYIKTDSGEMVQGYFAIDKDGKVYEYEDEYGMFMRKFGATAHNAEGMRLKYDKNGDVSEELVGW